MKRLPMLFALGLPLAIANTATASGTNVAMAMATSGSLSPALPKVLPVLVRVDASGKVTEASPSTALSPALDRLLRKNLDELVTGPAHRHGRAVDSQFVMNLYLRTTPRADGSYDVNFAYASTWPVPAGRWHWVNLDGRRLALAPDGGALPRRIHLLPVPLSPPRGTIRGTTPPPGSSGSATSSASPRTGH